MTTLGSQLMIKETQHAYSNIPQRIDVYDLLTGAISPDDTAFQAHAQNQSDFTIRTGKQIGVIGNYVLGFGEDFHTEMENEQYGGSSCFSKFDSLGNPVKPFLVMGNHYDAIAWDNNEAYLETKKYELSGTNGLAQSLDYAVANPPPIQGSTTQLSTQTYSIACPSPASIVQWKPAPVTSTNRAQALTSNCLVQLSGSGDICVMDRVTGAQYFHVNTGSETYLQGLAVDRSGKILAVNRVGDVVCFGTPDPVIVTPPQNVAGINNGQPTTFSVEAAGAGLSYQWLFNGVVIAGATSATYTIPSVSDSNAGAYSVTVSNTSNTVTSAVASLALSVATTITSPTNGATFSQPGDGQPTAITLSATATSLTGTITKVEFYSSGTNLLTTATTAPYSINWPAMPGAYAITSKAYDSAGKTGISQPVNISVAALALHYPLDENSGTIVHDSSGNGNNANITYSNNAASWTSQGLFNGSLVLSPTTTGYSTSRITTGPVTTMTNSAFTVSYWVNYSKQWAYGEASFSTSGSCGISANPGIIWYTLSGSKCATNFTAPSTIGTWYNYTVVATPSAINLFVDGTLCYSYLPPTGQTWNTSYQTFNFVNNQNGAGPFIGMMDEVKLYNNALNSADIMALYTTHIPYSLPLPTVSLTSPTNGTVITATNSVTLSAVTSGSHFPMTVNYYANGAFIAGTNVAPYTITWNNVPRGVYAITGTVTDGLGQAVGSNTANVTFSYVTAPVINLAGGTYLNAQNVNITCSDTSAVIYYTIDGSNPTTSSSAIVSGSSIPITRTTVLKIQAYKTGVYPSEIQTVIFRIGSGLAAGVYHSFALIPGAPLWVWGNNGNGQLGDGTTTQRNWPECVGSLNNLVSVSGGGWGNHSLGVDAKGVVWAWGYNNYGQLGNGNTTQQNSPVQLSTSNALSVSAGGYHSLAVKWDGSAWAWGYNSYGQLGNNGTVNKTSPVQVLVAGSTALTNVVAVAAGDSHSLALKGDGTVWTWGANYYGQLGNGTTTSGSVASQVTGLTGTVTAIAAGSGFSVALKSDGTVWAWGDNSDGELGNVSASGLTPSQVTGLTNVTAISCNSGGYHVLALRNDGTVWAWGQNGNCQLGDGTTTEHDTPFQIPGLSNIVTVGAGGYYSMALGNDGSLWAWGSNYFGSLGNNTTTTGSTPATSMSPSNPYAVFTAAAQSVSEGAPSFPVVTQLFCPATTAVSVPFTTSGSAVKNTDYTISASPVTISAGQTSGSIVITPIQLSAYKGPRTIVVTMGTSASFTKGITNVNTTTLTDDNPIPTVSFVSGSLTVTETTGTVQIPVQLSASAGVTVTVPFTVSGGAVSGTDFTITASPVSIAAGKTSGTITVTPIHRAGYQGNRSLSLIMGTPTNATIGSTGAETITITDVDPMPVSVVTPMVNQSVSWGQTATFSVAVTGSTPAYQWFKNGTAIGSATNASYTTPPTVVADNGALFSVAVTNAVSSATSSATLSVACYTPPQVSICNPLGGAGLFLPLNLAIQVEVQSPAVASIQFYQGSTLLGQITSGTSFTWKNVPAGSYALTAVVADTEGQTTTSAPVYITIAPPAAFDDWIVANGLTGSHASETASPAGDNIANLMKYALGLNPNTPCIKPTDGINPGLPMLGCDGANLTLTFQEDTSKSDVVYTVEASGDMISWSGSNVTLTVTGSNGTVETVKASVPMTGRKQFLHLKVSEQSQ